MNPSLKSQFLLDPDITYLNFGSYGACPRPIFEDYQHWQRQLETEPVQFIAFNGPKNLARSRAALAAFVHCDADDLIYVTNPSYGVNIIAKSLKLQPEDEVLSTDLEYGACDKTWSYYCKQSGATYRRQHISLPLISKEKIVEELAAGVNNNTKAIFISHITSVTALILPVAEICALARERGIMVIVDGAHVPGHIPVDLSKLQPDVYTGACHKWMMTAKGSSFLFVRKELQPLFDPLLISWGYDNGQAVDPQFISYHQMQGTRDFSAFLTIPAAIKFREQFNWEAVAAECRALVQTNAMRFCELLGTKPISPITDEFLGQMFSIPVQLTQPEAFQRQLFNNYRIEIPVMQQDGHIYIRYSLNGFNSQSDLDHLYTALKESLPLMK